MAKSIDSILLNALKEIYYSFEHINIPGKSGGWIRLTDVGLLLSQKKIKPYEYGVSKLRPLIELTNAYEIYADESKSIPVYYIRLKRNSSIPTYSKASPKNNSKEGPTQKTEKLFENTAEDLYKQPVVGKYYRDLIEEEEFGWPEVVGFYEINDKGQYQISDIRDALFHEHKYPSINGDEENREIIIALDGPINTLRTNTYYKFNWKITISDNERGYVLDIDKSKTVKRIDPHELTDNLHKLWDDRAHGSAMNTAMETISSELMASSDGTFIYELLQNANDYPIKDSDGNIIPVEVEFHMTDKCLICRHSGSQFTPRDVASICSIGNGSKTKNKNAIGYKGIGFKTVFHAHDWVYVRTGAYMFRFDKNHEKEGRPFQIMPVWTTIPELMGIDSSIAEIIKNGYQHFNVQTVMMPRKYDYLYGMDKNQDSEKSHEYVLRDMFKDIRDIIFIPNIKSVKVFFPGEEPIICAKGESLNWTISEFYKHILDEETERKVIVSECNNHPERRIPPKYKTFTDTYVSFAAKRNGNVIEAVEDATVNCYLPTKAEFGFPFLMNTDMVPSGDRSQLKTDVQFNKLFAKIAGQQFVNWLRHLLTEGFTPESVFNLIPDFEKAKSGVGKSYAMFIDEFEAGFKENLGLIPIIPVEGNDDLQLPCNVIRDVTGFSTKKILDQLQFRSLTNNLDKYLPLECISSNPKLAKILKDDSKCAVFKEENLQDLFKNSVFLEELAKPQTNTKVIEFILDYPYKNNYLTKALFINQNTSKLCPASSLFFDIDEDRLLLTAFENQLSFLAPGTRKALETDSSEGCNYLDKIKVFSWADYKAYSSVIKPLFETSSEKDNNLTLLKVEDTNLKMFKFIVKHGINAQIVKSFPIILADNQWGLLSDICFFYNKDAVTIQSQKWVDTSWYSVLSDKYIPIPEQEKKKAIELFGKYNVIDFSKKNLYDKVIKGQAAHIEAINLKTKDLAANAELLHFLYSIKDEKEIGTFNHFSLPICNDDNTISCKTGKDNIIFMSDLSSNQISSLLKKDWINEDWAFNLDPKCNEALSIYGAENAAKFLKEKFSIKDATIGNFCKYVVIKNLKDIITSISPLYKPQEETEEITNKREIIKQNNLDFFKFICDNYSYIFAEGTNPFHATGYPFITCNSSEITSKPNKYYRHSVQAKDAACQDWMPEGIVGVISDSYDSYAKDKTFEKPIFVALKATEFSYSSFLKEDVASNKRAITEHMSTIDLNISFHNYFKANRDNFSKEEQAIIKSFPVYVMGENGAVMSMTSTGHHINNSEVEGLIKAGFAQASSMDIIPAAYFSEKKDDKEYWIDILGNIDYTFKEIVDWITTKGKENVRQKTSEHQANISFWRIIKGIPGASNKDNQKHLSSLRVFPLYSKHIKDNECKLNVLSTDLSCYVSDNYFVGSGGIEYMLSEYVKEAYTVQGDYLENTEDDTIISWKKFWESAGFLSSNEELIMNTIIPNLDKPENINTKVPVLLYQNKDIIEKYLADTSNPDVVNKLKNDLNKIHVESNGGLVPISSIVFIQQNEFAPFEEPMPYLPLLSQIKDYGEDQVRFYKSIGERAGSKVIADKESWLLAKLLQFSNQQHLAETLSSAENAETTKPEISEDVHYLFIKDIAAWWNHTNSFLYSSYVKGIKLYNSKGVLCSANTLTEGSAYSPYCDFQSCGIESLDYISDKYSQFKGILALLGDMGIHHLFQKEDIALLDNQRFATYFWNSYLSDSRSRESVSSMIEEGLFKNAACVPTKNGVKTAESLYNTFDGNGKENLSSYVNQLEKGCEYRAFGIYESFKDQQNESIEYPNPIRDLDFLGKLSKDHCFEYLLNSKVDNTAKRRYVLSLLLEYHTAKEITEDDLQTYHKSSSANWLNGKKESAHINTLYAIGRRPEDKFFLRHFGNDSLVISNDTISDDDNAFDTICQNILQIKILHGGDNSDFKTIPSADKTIESERIRQILTQKSLLLSTIINAPEGESWYEAYTNYLTIIADLNFVRCGDITITCKEENSLYRKNVDDFYYDDSTKTFYYLNDWQDKFIFAPMSKTLIEVMDIPGKDDERTIMRILNKDLSTSEIIRMVKEYCASFFEDEKFLELLGIAYPRVKDHLNLGPSQKQVENEPQKLVGFSREREELSRESEKQIDCGNDYPETEDLHSNKEELSTTDISRNDQSRTNEGNQESDKEEISELPESGLNQIEKKEDKIQSVGNGESKQDLNNEPSASGISEEDTSLYGDQEDYEEIDPDDSYYEVSNDNDSNINRGNSTGKQRPLKPSSKEGVESMRSYGSPALELESLDPTEEEIDILSQYGITPEMIADTNYLAKLRLYQNLKEDLNEDPEETLAEFIKNGDSVSDHKLKGDKYIHACSAAKGVMYISPKVWKKILSDKWIICVYLDGRAKNFAYIKTKEEFLKLVKKDDVVIKMTGDEKVDVVNALYSDLLKDVRGTAYTLIRVAAKTNIDAVFANYVGAMADKNEDVLNPEEY